MMREAIVNPLVSQFCDADARRTNEVLGNLAGVTPIDMLPALQQIEYQYAWASGVKALFDPQDFWNWTEGRKS